MNSIAKITLLVLLFLESDARAQSLEGLNKYLSDLFKHDIIPGFSVVVVQKGKIIYSKGYGVEIAGSKKPFTPKTVCAIGSLTKSMTAMAMMQLVDQGKVDLDRPVIHYLPWFQTANKERSDKITVRMLLDNSSGLYSASASQGNDSAEYGLENMVRSLASTFLTREPGLAYQYSNVGFSVAGLIISKVSGMPYRQFMHEKIFLPLKMIHTSTDPEDFIKLNAINGHYFGIKAAIPAEQELNKDLNGYTPAGSLMCSSAEDLGKYLLTLMNAGSSSVLSLRSRNEMWKQLISFPGLIREDGGDGKPFSYGLGWMISAIEGRTLIHHGGSTGKMSSFTVIDPENEIAASIVMNVDLTFINKYAFPTAFNIINNIIRIASGLSVSNYGIPTIKDPTLNDYTLNDKLSGRYIGDFELKSENVVFLFAGSEMQIRKSKNNLLECIIHRGDQIIDQFTLDFVNEVQAESRNIAMSTEVRFKINPGGKTTGLYFGDMEFIRKDEMKALPYSTIISPDKNMSFSLPKAWKIDWQKKHFTAQSPDGLLKLKGFVTNIEKGITPKSILDELLDPYSVKESGLQHYESFAKLRWMEKSFLCTINNRKKQIIVLQAIIGKNNFCMVLINEDGDLTTSIQSIVNPLLNSIKVYRSNCCEGTHPVEETVLGSYPVSSR
jgi:CubicO group peptidase (beta-lactamase class C family)